MIDVRTLSQDAFSVQIFMVCFTGSCGFSIHTVCSRPHNSNEGCAVIYLASKEYFRHGEITHLNMTLQQEY